MSNDNDGFSIILLLVYLWPIWLLLITYFTGRHIERKHYADIEAREAALRHIMVIAVKKPPQDFSGGELVYAGVVVSSDYFRRMLAAFRNFFEKLRVEKQTIQ